MKLKKTLVMVLAACMTVGVFAGTAMAEPMPSTQFEEADNGYIPTPADLDGDATVLPAEELKRPNVLGQLAIRNPETGEILFNGELIDGFELYNGWKFENDYWTYYVNGVLQRHWQNIDGKWYFFDSYGIMAQNGVAWVEDRLYYFDETGACDTTPGWKLVPDYFYVYENGVRQLIIPDQGFTWFYLNQNGYIQTGWNYIDGTWHMCDKQTGRMLCNEWYRGEGGYWYYFDEFTDMATGWMTVTDRYDTNRTYFFNNSGVLQWGWLNYGGNWYYLNPVNAARVEDSWAFIAGPEGTYWYLFDEDGVMQTGWQAVNTGRKVPVGTTVGPDGRERVVEEYQWKWYYLTSWGAMVKNEQFINGNWYNFGDDGELVAVWDNELATWVEPTFQATNYLIPGQGSTDNEYPDRVEYAR